MNATEFGGDPLCYYLRQSPGMAEISSGKGVIIFIVSYLDILSLVFLTCEEQVSSILQIVLAPQNPPCLCSHRACWHQGMSVRKARHKPHTLGNSGAGCQDASKHSARAHWKTEIFCKQKNYFCCLWIVSSNLSVPVSPSARSAMGDSSDMSPIPSLTCSLALPTKFLCRITQRYERIPQPTSLSCSRGSLCSPKVNDQVKGKVDNGSWWSSIGWGTASKFNSLVLFIKQQFINLLQQIRGNSACLKWNTAPAMAINAQSSLPCSLHAHGSCFSHGE